MIFYDDYDAKKISVTLEENTECQKLDIVGFKVTVSDFGD